MLNGDRWKLLKKCLVSLLLKLDNQSIVLRNVLVLSRFFRWSSHYFVIFLEAAGRYLTEEIPSIRAVITDLVEMFGKLSSYD